MLKKKFCRPPKPDWECRCVKVKCAWCERTGYKFKCFEPVCKPRRRCPFSRF